MAKIQQINVLSLAKIHAISTGFLGLICGILYSFGGLLIDVLTSLGWHTSSDTPGLSYGTLLAFGALIGMPIIFACTGFVIGIVVAIIFNAISKWTGRITVEIN